MLKKRKGRKGGNADKAEKAGVGLRGAVAARFTRFV